MCYVSPETIQKGIDDYKAEVREVVTRDPEFAREVLEELGYVMAGKFVEQLEKLNQAIIELCDDISEKEKAPASSEVEPTCSLCQKPWSLCFCIPL